MTLQEFYQICDNIIPNERGCQIWPGTYDTMRNDGGNQYISVRIGPGYRRYAIHRLALERKLGRKLKLRGLACHSCDFTTCVNMEHLFEGSYKRNTYDMMRKWRHGSVRKAIRKYG